MSIGKTLNLALSGMAFNGPDVPGFGGNAKEGLFLDWYKAGFLFPFFRNHCMRTSTRQEPWVFSTTALDIARRHIRLRYKLLPYLYNLFLEHERTGEAILRPLFHDFADSKRLPLAHVNDQFLVGPALMQAPFTVEGLEEREIAVPAARWWRADTAQWLEGPRKVLTRKKASNTPLFVREGSILPLLRGLPKDNRKDLRDIELLVVLGRGGTGRAAARFEADDGETFAYRDGQVSSYRLEAEAREGRLEVKVIPEKEAYGEVRFTPVTVEPFDEVTLERNGKARRLAPRPWITDLWGLRNTFYLWD
jgi:alpha-glucosidase